MLAARLRKLITARARKNKRTARMLTNARKEKHVTDDIYPSSVASTNEPLVGVRVKANYLEYIKVAGNSFQYFSRLRV